MLHSSGPQPDSHEASCAPSAAAAQDSEAATATEGAPAAASPPDVCLMCSYSAAEPSNHKQSNAAARRPSKPSRQRKVPPPGREIHRAVPHTRSLCEYLMTLTTNDTREGPLQPFVDRCIPPLEPLTLVDATQEVSLRTYARRVVKQHLQTAVVAVGCAQPTCSSCTSCVLDLQDPTTREEVARAAYATLAAAAASSPAQHHAVPVAGSTSSSSVGCAGGSSSSSVGAPSNTLPASTASFWPLTSPFSNPYNSLEHFKQTCQDLRDLPTLMKELLKPKGGHPPCKAKQRPAQQQQVAVPGSTVIQAPEWPFLTLVEQGSSDTAGDQSSSSSSAASNQPAGGGTSCALHVSTCKLRSEVWCWALCAADSWERSQTAADEVGGSGLEELAAAPDAAAAAEGEGGSKPEEGRGAAAPPGVMDGAQHPKDQLAGCMELWENKFRCEEAETLGTVLSVLKAAGALEM